MELETGEMKRKKSNKKKPSRCKYVYFAVVKEEEEAGTARAEMSSTVLRQANTSLWTGASMFTTRSNLVALSQLSNLTWKWYLCIQRTS